MNCTDEFIKKGSIKTNILKGILFLQNSLVTDSVYWNWMCLAALISAREVAGTQSMVNRWAPRAHLFLRFCPNLCYPSLPQLHHGRDNETLNHIIWCFQNSMDKGSWRATIHGVTKSWKPLSDEHLVRLGQWLNIVIIMN